MQRISSINPDRISWCCRELGITTAELAERLKIDPARLDREELRNHGLTFNQLRNLADLVHRGVLFFLESGEVIETQLHSPQFRTLTNQKPDLPPRVRAIIERVERQRDIYLSLKEDVGEAGQQFRPPRVTATHIANAAAATRQWLGLSEENTFAAYREAVESKGILVFRSNGYAGQWQLPKDSPISGFSLYDKRCPAVFIRRLRPESRQTFTLMHEVGHLLLHKSSVIDAEEDLYSVRGHEREANFFAGLVLVPNDHLKAIDDGQRPESVSDFDGWLKPFKTQWGVSGEVILRRLLDVGRVELQTYEDYRRFIQSVHRSGTPERGTRSYRYREPTHLFGAPFVRVVFDALNSKRISLTKASTYLDNLKISDVHALEDHLANL